MSGSFVSLTHDALSANKKAWLDAAPWVPSLAQYEAALQPIVEHMRTLDAAALAEYVAGVRPGTIASVAIHMFKEGTAK